MARRPASPLLATLATLATLGLAACGSPRTAPSPTTTMASSVSSSPAVASAGLPSAASVGLPLPAPGPALAACEGAEGAEDFRPGVSFLASDRVVHLRIASLDAAPAPEGSFGARCVGLGLEIRQVFRGTVPERPGEVLRFVIEQNTNPVSTARPAGAWWVGEQTLAPGRELVAFCGPKRSLTGALRASCAVLPAEGLVEDARLASEAESRRMPGRELIERTKARCASTSFLLPGYVTERLRDEARRDAGLFDALASLLEEPTCSEVSRSMLLSGLGSDTPGQARRLARAMLRLLATPEARLQHDNLVATYLPSLLGLAGGRPRLSAAEVFDHQPGRAAAAVALRAYPGHADAGPLRDWIAR
jgi:hypothetical protein